MGHFHKHHFSLRNPDGSEFLVLESGGREIVADFLRQGIIVMDDSASSPERWVYRPTS
jgi:hypothetical protein